MDTAREGTLLKVQNVTKSYSVGGLLSRTTFDAVADVSLALDLDKPEIFTVIGESGSGKTTLSRMILASLRPSKGTLHFLGHDLADVRSKRQKQDLMKQVQPIFQNPFEAFNPLQRVDRYLYSTARRFLGLSDTAEIERHANEALVKVGLSLAEIKGRYPHELSGGQLQRVAIARALIPGPKLIVADEPVSMVDASLRMSIVNLFKTLRDQLRVSIIYITHDLATAYYISDRIIIMQRGVVVEAGEARTVLGAPQHPYSRLLRDSVLSPDDAGTNSLMRSRQTRAA